MKKWEMDEGLGLLAEERTLLGFNLVLAISSISDSLRGPGREATANDVSEWLKSAKKAMSPKVVSVYLRIRDRFPPEAVVHRLQVDAGLKRHELLPFIGRSLAKRRIVTYFVNRFKPADKDGVQYVPGRSPAQVLTQTFTNFKSFLESGLCGAIFRDAPHLGWLQQLPDFMQEIIEFLAAVLSGTGKYDEAIDALVAENYLVPAERVLANKDVFTIDVELLEKDMAAWLIPDPPAAAAVEVKPDSQPESQKAEEPGAAPLPDQSEPDPMEEPLSFAAEGPPARAETFRMLVLNRCQQDMLDRLSADAWEKALLQATTSAKTANIVAGNLDVDLNATDGGLAILHIIDCKTLAITDCENAIRYPFRFGPAIDVVKLKNLMANIFGTKEGESKFRSCDAALIFDGRSRKYDKEVAKQLNAHIKFVAKEILPARRYEVFRLHYHNREFMDGGAVRKRATSANLQCPDHLESGICIMGKDFKASLAVLPRKHFDVPSTSLDGFRNQSRGFSGLNLNPEPVRVTADTRSCLASGSTVEQGADLEGEQEEDKGHLLFPWEWPENVWDEIFHSMGAAAGQLEIYHHTADQGYAALAALRHKYKYRTSALSEKHRQLIREVLAYRIVSDICSGSRDWGRKLRRETSLAGDVPTADESEIQPTGSKKQKTEQNGDNEGGGCSSDTSGITDDKEQ
ncbi:unnamed protein product [Symbiodinium necroappetens]|uniref:Uncharacterized protein n=1 Tax=Symbiodinium necroappetens TaxID=1628268 RepID=A0A812ZT43_9DINO|nr:unnamed protein product [Symbiodinium necroappetens]